MNYYEIGQRIRKFRKVQDLSQEELAEKIDISVTHMSHIETGSTKLSLPVFVAIAEALSVRTDDLLRDSNKVSASEEIAAVLNSCTDQQASVLSDIVKAAKHAMDQYL